MEPEGPLPHLQVPATCPYPKPHQLIPRPLIPLPEDSSQYYPPIYVWVLKVVSFLSGFPTKNLYTSLLSPIRAICSVHLILLDLIIWIFDDEYRSPFQWKRIQKVKNKQSSFLCWFQSKLDSQEDGNKTAKETLLITCENRWEISNVLADKRLKGYSNR